MLQCFSHFVLDLNRFRVELRAETKSDVVILTSPNRYRKDISPAGGLKLHGAFEVSWQQGPSLVITDRADVFDGGLHSLELFLAYTTDDRLSVVLKVLSGGRYRSSCNLERDCNSVGITRRIPKPLELNKLEIETANVLRKLGNNRCDLRSYDKYLYFLDIDFFRINVEFLTTYLIADRVRIISQPIRITECLQ